MSEKISATIEYRSEVMDNLGRRHFFLSWVTPSGRKRSQAFFADPADYGFKLQGKTGN
jgi:hypothetical protein